MTRLFLKNDFFRRAIPLSGDDLWRIRRKKRSGPTKGFLMDAGHPAERLIRPNPESRPLLSVCSQAGTSEESESGPSRAEAPPRSAGFRPKKEASRWSFGEKNEKRTRGNEREIEHCSGEAYRRPKYPNKLLMRRSNFAINSRKTL